MPQSPPTRQRSMASHGVDVMESKPAVEVRVRSLKEVADTYRWACFVEVDVPRIGSLSNASMVMACLFPMVDRRGWVVYLAWMAEEADLPFESLNELWWEVADVVQCVHATVKHLRVQGRVGDGAGPRTASSVAEDDHHHHLAVGALCRHPLSSSQDGVGKGAETGAAAEEMDGEVVAAAQRCSSPDSVGDGVAAAATGC